MLKQPFLLAWYFYRQQFNQPHQRLLRYVQGILLVFLITLSQSSNTIQQYLGNNLQSLLGADAVLAQPSPLTETEVKQLVTISNNMVRTQQIKTTLTNDGQFQRAKLKAVEQHYPLQGEFLTATSLSTQAEPTKGGPTAGHIWLDPRLMAGLNVNVNDQLIIANKAFTVSRVLHHEPDLLMEGHSVDMRAMVSMDDFDGLGFSTDLVNYRYLLAADAQQITAIVDWQQQTRPAAQLHHKQGKHPLALFWQRTENFLGLASIILFFMAAIAIEQLSVTHKQKDQFVTAVCLSLGANKQTGLLVSVFKWLISFVLLLPFALVYSLMAYKLIISWLASTFNNLTWQWDWSVTLSSVLFTLAIFALFHLPVWWSLTSQSVVGLFKGAKSVLSPWLGKITSLLVLCLIAAVYSDNGLLTLMMVIAIAVTISMLIGLSYLALTLAEKATSQISGLMPFSIFMMKQRLVSKSTQILGVGLCAFLLLFTLMLLKDLGASMSNYQRQHDGNVMVSQANQQQMEYISNWTQQKDVKLRQTKPYLYAKLIEINRTRLADYSEQPSESLVTMSQQIRMHWSADIPNNNRIVSGRWWQADSTNWQQVSVEEEVMTDLGLKIGDELTFVAGESTVQLYITASHVFKPGAGSITFWVQVPPTALEFIDATQYNMASLELADSQWPLLTELWQQFPTLRMLSLKELTNRFDNTLAMITKVISGFAGLIILLSAVVILASINAVESQEKKKNSVILSFGFNKNTCLKLNLIEWLITALIAATGAIGGTYIAGELIYQSQFSLPYNPNWLWVTTTLAVILISVTSVGALASRNSLKTSIKGLMADS